MILVDANVLVYATTGGPQQRRAHEWLEAQLWTAPRVGLPWPSLLAYCRLVSNPRIFPRPVPLAAAWRQVEEWLSLEAVWIPAPTERHAAVVGQLLSSARASDGNLMPDLHLAALALEHGLIVATADGDFARFAQVRTVNPLH